MAAQKRSTNQEGTVMMDMGKRLTEVMEEKNLTQSDVARGIGTSRQRIFQLMREREWTARNIEKMSAFLDVPVFKWFQR